MTGSRGPAPAESPERVGCSCGGSRPLSPPLQRSLSPAGHRRGPPWPGHLGLCWGGGHLPLSLTRKVCGEADAGAQRAPRGRSVSVRCPAAVAVDPGRRRPGQERGAADQPTASSAWGPAEEPAWATAWGDSAGRGRPPRDTPASEQVTTVKGAGPRTPRLLSPSLPEPWASRATFHGSWLLGFPDGCSRARRWPPPQPWWRGKPSWGNCER